MGVSDKKGRGAYDYVYEHEQCPPTLGVASNQHEIVDEDVEIGNPNHCLHERNVRLLGVITASFLSDRRRSSSGDRRGYETVLRE